jgi:hypothetical protein
MPDGEKHHYIPVFYLKQWVGADGRLCQYSRPYDRVKPKRVHPDGTGYVRGLYAIDDTDPAIVNAVETMFLKPSDGLAHEALQYLLREQPFPKPQMRTSWSRFVLSLMIRYPEALAIMKTQLRANVEKVYSATKKPEDPPTFAEYEASINTNELARLHGKLIMDLAQDSRMGRLVFSMHWGVVKFSRHRHTLLTSDRPIASNVFPISANHLCLPISPTRLFFACDTQRAENEFRQLDPAHTMLTVNDAVASHAHTYVYGTDDTQLRFVANRLGKSPIVSPFDLRKS